MGNHSRDGFKNFYTENLESTGVDSEKDKTQTNETFLVKSPIRKTLLSDHKVLSHNHCSYFYDHTLLSDKFKFFVKKTKNKTNQEEIEKSRDLLEIKLCDLELENHTLKEEAKNLETENRKMMAEINSLTNEMDDRNVILQEKRHEVKTLSNRILINQQVLCDLQEECRNMENVIDPVRIEKEIMKCEKENLFLPCVVKDIHENYIKETLVENTGPKIKFNLEIKDLVNNTGKSIRKLNFFEQLSKRFSKL